MFQNLMQKEYPIPEGGIRLFSDLNLEDCMKQIPEGIRTIVTEEV